VRRLGRTDLEVFLSCLGGNPFGWTADEAEDSLRRLQTDRSDLYYAHFDDTGTLAPLASARAGGQLPALLEMTTVDLSEEELGRLSALPAR